MSEATPLQISPELAPYDIYFPSLVWNRYRHPSAALFTTASVAPSSRPVPFHIWFCGYFSLCLDVYVSPLLTSRGPRPSVTSLQMSVLTSPW